MLENKFTDEENMKALGEVSPEKIKAIYPHIVVGGDIDKPCYSIQYYDIEKKTMFDCYASYKLGLVRKWLEEYFEVTELDFADLINRLQTDKEALIAGQETLQKALAEKDAEIEALKASENFVSSHSRFNALQNQLNEETKLREELLKTIKENNAEIERLKNDCFCIANERDAIKDCLNTAVEEAIKEFAERLRSEIVNKPSEFTADKGTVDFLNGLAHRQKEILDNIDILIKEMVGETL